jgi:putative membrane protein
MRRIGVLCATFAAIAIVCGCSKTQGTRPASEQRDRPAAAIGSGGAGANLSDEEFVRDVALKNMAEIELSRLASEKATSPEIKSFAQRMIDDHGAAGHSLESVVSGQRLEWPVQLDSRHRKSLDELAAKQGADFDRDYVKTMVESHQDLAAKLESRLDVQSLADWKTAAAGRSDSKALPEPATALRDAPVRPSRSDSEITTKINQWAADTYPVAQKHLDSARALQIATKGSTN